MLCTLYMDTGLSPLHCKYTSIFNSNKSSTNTILKQAKR